MKYNILNVIVILITSLSFAYEYRSIAEIFKEENFFSVLILIVAVVLIHIIKAGRLYLEMYGLDIDFVSYIKTYCKVTPVSVIIPFKFGEFFRMFCYGKELGDTFKGIVLILFDRFMDTVALVTAILLVWIFNGKYITLLVFILLIFIVFILLIYSIFPSVYKSWKKYLLAEKASENKLEILKILEILNTLYKETENIAKGRGAILYFISLVAWGIEIGSVLLRNNASRCGNVNQEILSYLTSVINGSPSVELKQFIFISVILLINIYAIIKVKELTDRKKACK